MVAQSAALAALAAPVESVESVESVEAAGNALPIIEETLRLDKVAVDQGGYRITKQVELHDELVDELLRNHRVEIERRPIGRPLEDSEVPQPRYEGDTLVVPALEEVLVTQKRLMPVEEVRITRIEGMHRRPQHLTLRQENVSIERLDAQPLSAPEPSSPPTSSDEASNAPAGVHIRSKNDELSTGWNVRHPNGR